MARILVTGATGWLGSLLAVALRARGHELSFLVRGDAGRQRLLDRLGPGSGAVVDGDIELGCAGVATADVERWRGRVDRVLHAAALVRLDDAAGDALHRVNVEGTRNVLGLAAALGAGGFVQVGSCSVAGDAARFGEDDLDVGQRLRNAYEESKLEAEKLVRSWPGRLTVLRVPGVLGDAVSGAVPSFSGTYYTVLAAYRAVREELADAWRDAPAELLAEGIAFDRDGSLALPVHVAVGESARCQMVPQDWLASTVADLIGDDATGTFQLVHPGPPRASEALAQSLPALGVVPPPRVERAAASSGPWARRIGRWLDRMLRPHRPYLEHVPKLGDHRLRRQLGARYTAPPALDAALFARMVRYAVSRGFAA